MAGTHEAATPETVVELSGGIADDLADYARTKIDHALERTSHPVLYTRVRVVRHDPARNRPVTAQVNVDLDGRLLRAQTDATSPREAVDRLVDRLTHQLERVDAHPDSRADYVTPVPPKRGLAAPPTPDGRIVRRKVIDPAPCSVDDAVAVMEDLDHDFWLFREATRDVDSVVYHGGPTGVRLAQADGEAEAVPEGEVPFTASTVPAPRLEQQEALERIRTTGWPFLFYVDADHGGGCVIYQRYDGNYGVIEPEPAQPM